MIWFDLIVNRSIIGLPDYCNPNWICYQILTGAIQVLRNAMGGGGVSAFPEQSVTKV